MMIVNQIVDRCHCFESNRHVIRYFISRLKNGYKSWMKASRKDRRKFLKLITARHDDNLKLYVSVMKGN